MNYTKPQVVIDLLEYEALKKEVESLRKRNAEKDAIMYRKVISVLVECSSERYSMVCDRLRQEGISLNIVSDTGQDERYKRILVREIVK